MSTHAGIGMIQNDGTVKAIYLQFDGYPSGAGVILAGWYNTEIRVAELLDLGDLSSLGTKIAPMPGREHSKTNPQENVTVAYNRDCDAGAQPAQIFADKAEYELNGKSEFEADYLYLFEHGKWFVKGIYHTEGWILLTEKTCKQD